MSQHLLEVKNLHTWFDTSAGKVSAVRGISFSVEKGESLGIVGESGCGKSVSMLSIMRLLDDNAKMEAEAIRLDGEDLLGKSLKEMRGVQGNEIGMIFQDPMTSLNPLFTIGEQIRNPLMRHKKLKKKEADEKARDLLEMVGIPSPEKRLKQYPHELSGGMRQRVMIAIALCCGPKHCRRAHYRPGCNHPGPDPGADRSDEGAEQHVRDPDHPRSGRDLQPLQPGFGDVRGPCDGIRLPGGYFLPYRPPLHGRAFGLYP